MNEKQECKELMNDLKKRDIQDLMSTRKIGTSITINYGDLLMLKNYDVKISKLIQNFMDYSKKDLSITLKQVWESSHKDFEPSMFEE